MVLFYFHHAGYDLSFEEIHKVTKKLFNGLARKLSVIRY